jgi:type VI secretion system protein VasI
VTVISFARGTAVKRSLAMAMQVVVLLGPSSAQEDLGAAARAAFCSIVEDSVARLACFDKAFPRGDHASSPAAQPPNAPAEWSVEVGKSEVDGSPTIVAMLTPTEASGEGSGRGLALVLQCAQNTTSVSFSTDIPVTDETVPVTISIDDAPAVSSSWSRSETGSSVGLWRGATAIPFIRSLPDNGQLVVRIGEPGQVAAQFNVGKVGDVRQQVAEACEWPVVPPKPGAPEDTPMELGIQ